MATLAALLTAPTILLTGYTATGNPTASGTWPVAGVTAACPPQLALGSRIAIDGLGERTCEDRYRADLTPRVDVFVNSAAEAYAITGRYGWQVVGA